MNLIEAAIRSTPAEMVRYATTICENIDTSRIWFEVQDTGAVYPDRPDA